MTVDDLQYTEGTMLGDTAYLFDINSNFSGYTFDKQLFHVLDRRTYVYNSFQRADLNAALVNGSFDDPATSFTTTNDGSTVDTNIQIVPPPATDWLKTGLAAVIGFMILYIMTRGK